MNIPHETWGKCQEDYVRGKGSLATLAMMYGLKKGTLEKCAKREGWTRLRLEFETRQRDRLLPPLARAPSTPAPPTPQNELERQLRRIEAHRDRIDELIAKETDPTKLDRLSSARARLFEQWRILSNIPLPGSRKPPKERRRQDYTHWPEPVPAEVMPYPEPAPAT